MHSAHPLPLIALAASMLFSSCKGLYAVDMSRGASDRTVSIELAEGTAIDAIRAGDYQAAGDALGELIFAKELAIATTSLAAGEAEDALSAIDRALRVKAYNEDALLIKAKGSAILAQRMIARGDGALYVEGALLDSFESYLALPASPEVLLGASQAAGQLGRKQPALDYARMARELMAQTENDPVVEADITRAWGEASYRAFTSQLTFERSSGASGEEMTLSADELYLEAEDSLARFVGHRPGDVWAWCTLGDLYTWAGDSEQASDTFGRGLDRMPQNQVLLDRFFGAASTADPDVAVSALAALNERHPGNAPALLMLGRERLRATVAAITTTPAEARTTLVQAEAELARARGIDPENLEMANACLGWEVIARNGQGWCDYNTGDLESAMATFLSMENIFQGGMAWKLGTDLRSGVDGVWWVGDQYRQSGQWERAAEAFETLHAYQPGDSNWANNAGFFCRDAGVELETMARNLCAASLGKVESEELLTELRANVGIAQELFGSPEEAELFRVAADNNSARAVALLERSYLAYLDASALVPEDVRVVNDTALVAVYYLHKDLELAEAYLRRSIDMGQKQLAADAMQSGEDALSPSAREALTEAWGDAYQNLGVLYLLHKRDPEGAIPFFQKSVEAGPSARPFLTEALIPFAQGKLDATIEQVMPDEIHWGANCAPTK
jgi:tetratricopeptide (TPR) repeat protein